MTTTTTWTRGTPKERPGLYINFVRAAIAQVRGGLSGVVALAQMSFAGGTATAKTFYTVSDEGTAATLFGQANIQSIKFALQAGAKSILVYTLPVYNVSTVAQDYIDMRTAFDGQLFDVFVHDGEVTSAEQDNALSWMKTNRDNGKPYLVVFGGSTADDQTPATGNARSVRLKDDNSINLIGGVSIGTTNYTSSQFASYIAGLLASTPINKSVTFTELPVSDVTRRLTNVETKAAINSGSLVLTNDGEVVKIERAVCTSSTAGALVKIRKVRAEMLIFSDLTKTANKFYVGKIDNTVDGQKALIAAFKAYLETLENQNVLVKGASVVDLDTQTPSVGDEAYFTLGFIEVDSMEAIYLTINV